MKILHLINNLRREGAQVVVSNLVTSAAGAVRHVVCTRTPRGALQVALEAQGIPVFSPVRYYGALSSRHLLRLVDRVVQEEGIDLVHAHMADCAVLAVPAAARRGLPLVITHHGQDILPDCEGGVACRAVYALLLALAARYARRNVAVAPAVAEAVMRRLLLHRRCVEVIVNGVRVPPLEQTRGARDAAKGPRIVSIGRLVELKGQEQLIAAAARLAERYWDLQVAFVGDGPLRAELGRKARGLGVAERITFTGAVDDVGAHLLGGEVYVSTSHREGTPLAILEAMGWMVPVVASDVEAHRAIVHHRETGLLYPAGDPAGLAKAIMEMLDHPAEAQAYARSARRLVEQRYSADAAACAYERLYGEVLQGAASRAIPMT